MVNSVHLILVHPDHRRRLIPLLENMLSQNHRLACVHAQRDHKLLSPLLYSSIWGRIKRKNELSWTRLSQEGRASAGFRVDEHRVGLTLHAGREPELTLIDPAIDSFIAERNSSFGITPIRVHLEPPNIIGLETYHRLTVRMRARDIGLDFAGRHGESTVEGCTTVFLELVQSRAEFFAQFFARFMDTNDDYGRMQIIIRDPWGILIEKELGAAGVTVQRHDLFSRPLDPLNEAVFNSLGGTAVPARSP